ncbi:MAG: DEAD/DEAH box helicase [Pirellulales bacterium]|nr:DEAD/DEAH box helicase [Pirellulales bacterium]
MSYGETSDPGVVVSSWRAAPAGLEVFSQKLTGSAQVVTSITAHGAAERMRGIFSAPRPTVISLPLGAPRLQLSSFQFAVPAENKSGVLPSFATPAAPLEAGEPLSARGPYTRVRPPGDLVKLEDRLHYLLQPPLEVWMQRHALELPFPPFPYQLEGIAFLYPRYTAVLADEMGLGKTMQSITAMRLLLHSGEVNNILLVCPKPLVANWQREFKLWAPELPLVVVSGDRHRRHWQWRLNDTPIKIANYELLLRDEELVTSGNLHFDLVVLDESQRIKNRSSSTAQTVRAIPRRRSWALTGTPVENSAEDLVGIFEFLSPGYLSDGMKLRRMGRLARDYVLRRTKDQVLKDLPPKLFRDAELELSPAQRESYRLAEEEGIVRLTEMGESASIQHVLELILRLKQICNFDPATGDSAKLERLSADLEEVAASGQKAIVFSQWVSVLETLAERLKRFHPLQFHGRVPSAKREGILEEFRNDPRRHVLLLSYGAGGVGLNLQFCNYVFLFDRWWNPAVEDQAINRAHRIGVAGQVTVSRFLTLATIEERIDQILRQKREIFDTLFSETGPQTEMGMNRQEIFGLFRLRCPGGEVSPAPVVPDAA